MVTVVVNSPPGSAHAHTLVQVGGTRQPAAEWCRSGGGHPDGHSSGLPEGSCRFTSSGPGGDHIIHDHAGTPCDSSSCTCSHSQCPGQISGARRTAQTCLVSDGTADLQGRHDPSRHTPGPDLPSRPESEPEDEIRPALPTGSPPGRHRHQHDGPLGAEGPPEGITSDFTPRRWAPATISRPMYGPGRPAALGQCGTGCEGEDGTRHGRGQDASDIVSATVLPGQDDPASPAGVGRPGTPRQGQGDGHPPDRPGELGPAGGAQRNVHLTAAGAVGGERETAQRLQSGDCGSDPLGNVRAASGHGPGKSVQQSVQCHDGNGATGHSDPSAGRILLWTAARRRPPVDESAPDPISPAWRDIGRRERRSTSTRPGCAHCRWPAARRVGTRCSRP